MERRPEIKEARSIFGSNFIGPEELNRCRKQTGIEAPNSIPPIPFSLKILRASAQQDNLLFLSAPRTSDGRPLTLLSLRDRFGTDPTQAEPCFYNQDWYLKEKFIKEPMQCRWHLISKVVSNESRGEDPALLVRTHSFPPAVLCAYIFFVHWFHSGEILWRHDFIWCADVDHNGDRIYVGKYQDINGANKNGFSIHRHLTLRDCYGCVQLK